MIDDADDQEQGGLVEGVNDQERHGGGNGHGRRAAQEHGQRAQGHDGRVGKGQLQIGLAQRHNRGQHRRNGTEDRQGPDPDLRAAQGRMHAGEQIDAGLHHGRGMQVGADRRRRGHRIGQPEVKRELGRLGERARQHQDQDRQVVGVSPNGIAIRQDLRQLEGTGGQPQHDQAGQQGEAPGAGQQQGLQRRPARLGRGVVEADQQVGRERRQFPKDEQRDQIVGQHQAEHGEHEQQQEELKPPQLGVAGEIGVRIKDDQDANAADQQGKGQAEAVNQKREVDAQAGHPGKADADGLAGRDRRQQGREQDRQDGRGQNPKQTKHRRFRGRLAAAMRFRASHARTGCPHRP